MDSSSITYALIKTKNNAFSIVYSFSYGLIVFIVGYLLVTQVAKSIKIVMTSRLASVVITLDMEIIQKAQLYIDANIVKESILQTPKIKLKEQVRFLIDDLDTDTLDS